MMNTHTYQGTRGHCTVVVVEGQNTGYGQCGLPPEHGIHRVKTGTVSAVGHIPGVGDVEVQVPADLAQHYVGALSIPEDELPGMWESADFIDNRDNAEEAENARMVREEQESEALPDGWHLAEGQSIPKPPGVVLPYAGTSGWSGSETSRSTTVDQDNDGRTLDKQQRVLELMSEHVMVPFDDEPLYRGRSYGLTWREIDRVLGWGHGSISRVLSDLHKAGLLARLSEVRNRCKVYVLPEYVAGRETEPHGGRGGDRLTLEERRAVTILRRAMEQGLIVSPNYPGRIKLLLGALDRLAPEPKD